METHKLGKQLWDRSLGRPTFFRQEGGLVALAFCVDVNQRLPEAGFAVHSGPEAFVVLSGRITIGTHNGEHEVAAGTLAILDAGEHHYTLNRSGAPATLVSFGLSGT